MNVYGYAAGDPINQGDPFGLSYCRLSKQDCDRVLLSIAMLMLSSSSGCQLAGGDMLGLFNSADRGFEYLDASNRIDPVDRRSRFMVPWNGDVFVNPDGIGEMSIGNFENGLAHEWWHLRFPKDEGDRSGLAYQFGNSCGPLTAGV